MKSKVIAIFATLALAFATPAHAQQPRSRCSRLPNRSISSIQAPLATISRNREGHDTIAGTLTDPSGQSLPISLALRGITRRTSDILRLPAAAGRLHRAAAAGFAVRRAEEAEARHPLPQFGVVPAICAARICSLPNVQSADSDELPGAAREHRLSRREWPPDHRRESAISSRILSDVAHRNGLKVARAPSASQWPTSSPADAGALRPVRAHDRQP